MGSDGDRYTEIERMRGELDELCKQRNKLAVAVNDKQVELDSIKHEIDRYRQAIQEEFNKIIPK